MDEYQTAESVAKKAAETNIGRAGGYIAAGGRIGGAGGSGVAPGNARPERELERLCAMLSRAESTLTSATLEIMAHLDRLNGESSGSGAKGVAAETNPSTRSFMDAHLASESVAMLAERLRDQIGRLDAI